MRLGNSACLVALAALAALGGGAVGCGSASTGGAPADGADAAADSPAATPDPRIGGYYVCGRTDDAPDCFACCASYVALGQKKLLAAAAACTCAPAYCGSTDDGGAAAPDAGADVADAADAADARDASQGGPDATSPTDAASDAEGEAGEAEDGGDAGDGGGDGGGHVRRPHTGVPPMGGPGSCSASMCSQQEAPSQDCVVCVLGILEGAAGPPLCPEAAAACNADPDCADLLKCSANCPGTAMD